MSRAHRWVLFALLLSLFACSRGTKATVEPKGDSGAAMVSASVTPAPTLSVPASPSSSAAAALAPVDVPFFPTPPTPPGANAREVEIASAVCNAEKMGKVIGCGSHPPFVSKDQMPDGTLKEHQGDPLTFCGIDTLYDGSFTASGRKQVLVSFAQCKENDPGATWDAGFPGSGVVVEKTDGARWKVVAYEPDVNLPRCKISHLKKADRDVLFCWNAFSAGAGTMTYFVHVDFARKGARKAATVAYLFDDDLNCMMMTGPDGTIHVEGWAALEARNFNITDVNGDGTPDLIIDVNRGAVPASSQLDAALKAACKKAGGGGGVRASIVPKSAMKITKIEIVSSPAESFAPTALSKKLLEEWAATANTGATQLRGAAPPAMD